MKYSGLGFYLSILLRMSFGVMKCALDHTVCPV